MSKKLKKNALIGDNSAELKHQTNQEAQAASGETDPGLGQSEGIVVFSKADARAAVILSMRIQVDNKLTYKVEGYQAIEISELMVHMPRYFETFVSARRKIARALKMKPESLPIVCGVFEGEVVMSIVAPVGKDSAVILDAAQPICNAITASWRAVAEAVQRASINCQVKSDTDFKLDPDGDGGQCEGKTESALQQVKIDPLGKTFMAALKANHDGGTVQLNFTSARQPFDLPAVAVPPVPIPQDPKISLGAKRIVVAEIYRRTGANHCTMRELDVTKLRTAEFSTNGPLSATINMLIGCPAVHLEIRDFISDSPAVPAAHDFLILRVVGLTPDWHFEPRVIDFLYNCVDEIEALMPEEMRRANR